MSGKVKKTVKNGKRKDVRRRRIIQAGIAVIMVLAMVIAIFGALFMKGGSPDSPPASGIESGR